MAGILSGSVVRSEDLAPLCDAEVVIAAVSASCGEEILSVFSDTSGSFLFANLSPGPWEIACRWSGRLRARVAVTVLDNALTSVQIDVPGWGGGMTDDPVPTGLGSVDGRVVDAASGRPVADAAVVIERPAGAVPDIAPITDALGRFALAGLPEGEWVFAAFGPTGETGMATVRVLPDRITTMVIRTG